MKSLVESVGMSSGRSVGYSKNGFESVRMPQTQLRVDAVDGLRAIAMTMVIAQHSGLLPFGWTGVWLFYVISGYVITRGILAARDETATFRHRYGEFLWKRFLRIVPVYLAYLLVNVLVLVKFDGTDRLGDLPYLLSFTYNWQMVFNFWPGGGGWGPFGHLWTLSVEQQFYLVFPLLALLMPDRWQTRSMLFLVCLGPLLRWQWANWLASRGMQAGDLAFAVYSATHCHFDAFLAGALVARWQRRGGACPKWANRVTCSALVVAAVYASAYVALNYHAGQRGVEALRNVYSGILYGSGREVWVYVAVDLLSVSLLMQVLIGRFATPLLNSRFLVWVGRVSYGGYLFHILVLWSLGQWLGQSAHSALLPRRLSVFLTAWLLTVVLASISFRWFEQPLARRWRNAIKASYVNQALPRHSSV